MILGPGLAVGGFGFANDDDGHVRLLRYLGGGVDGSLLLFWIGKLGIVLIPAGPSLFASGDLAAFGVKHFHARSRTGSYAVENTNASTRISGVTAQMNVGRVGSDDGDGSYFLGIERQHGVVILQQYDCFFRRFFCQLLVFGAVRRLLGIVRVDVGVF